MKNRPARADNYEIFNNRDPRLYETIRVQKRGLQWRGSNTTEIWPGGRSQKDVNGNYPHGMGNVKWVLNHESDGQRARLYSWPILRMGGFHLIYAEALAETGNMQAACDQINIVRDRVGLGKIESFIPAVLTDKDVMIKEIIRERACELGYEDTRFMDMVRRKLKDDFTKTLHGLYTYRVDGKQGSADVYPDLWYDRRIVAGQPRKWWTNWDDKWYLCAFPRSEINKGWGLIQNPGWDSSATEEEEEEE